MRRDSKRGSHDAKPTHADRSNSGSMSGQRQNKNDGMKRPRQDPKESEKERQRIKRLRDEGKCFHCESPNHMAKDCPQRHNKKPPMRLNSVGMSATEIKLAALSEGKEMGLFVLGNEPHLIEYEPGEMSDEFWLALRDVLWAR